MNEDELSRRIMKCKLGAKSSDDQIQGEWIEWTRT